MDRVVTIGWLVWAGCIPIEIPAAPDSSTDDKGLTEDTLPGDTSQPTDTGTTIFEPDEDGDGYDQTIDCDDGNAAIHPEAAELCNGIDDDCSGVADNDPVDASTWYADIDEDGYGQDLLAVTACEAPTRYARLGGDCDDANSAVHPEAAELWYDGVDQNCDGWSDFDQDEDGHDGLLYGGDDCNDRDDGISVVPDMIASSADLALLSDCTELSQLNIQLDNIGDLYLPTLMQVTGPVTIYGTTVYTVYLPSLVLVGGDVVLYDLPYLQIMELQQLSSIGGSLFIQATALFDVHLPSLSQVAGQVWLVDNPDWCPAEYDWQSITAGDLYTAGNACGLGPGS